MKTVHNIIHRLSAAERLQFHTYHTQPTLNESALFTDGSSNFMMPMEPKTGDTVKVRFRTARANVEHLFLCMGEEKKEMRLIAQTEKFDFYQISFQMGEEMAEYYFEIHSGELCCYYNKKGPSFQLDPFYNFKVTPGFSTPDWAKGAIFYQIYVDRFANGDPANDVVDREYIYIDRPVHFEKDWEKYPEAMDVHNFYGGDIQGVLDHLDYLSDLGVDVIYLNPIFVSPSNHKYDIQDYDYVDPHFGKIVVDEGEPLPEGEKENSRASKYISRVTDKRNLEASNKFFIHFVEEVHKRGMRVILDGVFNHCGSFNKWMDAERIYENQPGYEKGAYNDANSPYRSFFQFYHQDGWPYNGDYEGWWGHKTLPKLHYEASDTLYQYILDVGRKWVSPPYNADGWRLDVAADLGQNLEYNHQFWRDFRKAVKEANPDAIILAEHYDDPEPWLRGDQWDTVMNYQAFMEPVSWYLTGMEKHSDEKRNDLLGNEQAFVDAMCYHVSRFQYPSLVVAMNELSNHDHSRFLTRTNQMVGRTATVGPEAAGQNINKAVMRAAVMIQMTWLGAPTIYYGDEAGLCGWTDPDNRRTYPWGKEDLELIRYHKDIIRIHKESEALMRGSLKYLSCGFHGICYGRFTLNEKMLILVHAGSDAATAKIPVWELGVTDQEEMVEVMFSREEGYETKGASHPVKSGCIEMILPGNSAVLLKAVRR